jgi:hypothetical protein
LVLLLVAALIPSLQYYRQKSALTPERPLPVTTAIRGPFTEREGQQAAIEVAKFWAADSFLELARYAPVGGDKSPPLGSDGRVVPPNGWSYRSLSPNRVGTLLVNIHTDGTCRTEIYRREVRPGERPLPPDTLDSPTAMRIAESQFSRWNEGRNGEVQNLWAQVSTIPTRFFGVPDGSNPRRPTWQFVYLVYFRGDGELRRSDLHVNLDAVTGEVLTVVELSGEKAQVLLNKY